MVRINRMQYINIYSDSHGSYIVHNTKKDFSEGHTHINNYNTAKYVAYMALYKRIPKKKHLSNYLIESVIRISTDKKYINQMKQLHTDNKEKSTD